MAAFIHLFAATASGTIRVCEKFLPISKNTELYLDGKISFKEATDDIVKNIRIYIPLTTAKTVSDLIFLNMTGQWIYEVIIHVRLIFKGLINCGLEAFKNGIKLSLEHFFLFLQKCSIGIVISQFKYLFDRQKKGISAISIIDFCNICNNIYLFINGTTNGFKKTIQLELIKYWLECMGIVRAIAEYNNINFVKYMNQCCPKDMSVSELIDF
jgi:hypothetical protein